MVAKPLLNEGLICRVGASESVEIWNDKWLPIQMTFKPQSSIRFLQVDAKVSTLIDKTTTHWNLDLIDAIFTKEEAALIKEIPQSPYPKPNRLIWRCSILGDINVKSAYHLLTELDGQKLGQYSNQTNTKDSWTKIWQLESPNASKTFIWRACLNALTTRANLVKRKVVEDPTCPIFKQQPETIEHILWACPSARMCWVRVQESCKRPALTTIILKL